MTTGETVEPPESAERYSRVRRFVSIAIVATTVLTAVVGYFASTASRAGDQASARAERLAVQALAEAVRARQEANQAYEMLVVAAEQDRRAANTLQQSLFASGSRLRALRAKQRDWERVAARVRTLAPVPAANVVEDPDARERFFAETRYESLRLAGLRDAGNDESAAWGAQVASYTAVLTLLAVALYLLGFSLSRPQRPRLLFVIVGLSLSVISLGWATATRAASPSRPPDEAAADYARGVVRLQSARSPSDYRAAERHFSAAIRRRPDHAWAFKDRAESIFAGSSPQPLGTQSLTAPGALRRATEDVRTALELGLENYVVLADLGFNELSLALVSRDAEERDRLLEAGVDHLRRSLRLSPETVSTHYDLALGLLAQGRRQDARSAYRNAIEQTFSIEVDGTRKRRDPYLQEGYVADALTNLARLEASRPELRGEIAATKELIVGSVARGRTRGPTRHDDLSRVRLDIFPNEVQASRIRERELDPDRPQLSAQWWVQGREHLGWSVLADVSGPVSAVTATYVDIGGTLDRDTDLPGTYYFRSDALLGGLGSCLKSGTYRLELYVDGDLVATRTTDVELAASKTTVIPALDLLICTPPQWKLLPTRHSGLLAGLTSPDGRSGVYLFRVALPLSLARLKPAEQGRQLLALLVERFAGLFPAEPVFQSSESLEYFLGLDGRTRRFYSYRGGEIDANAGVTDDGTVIAAIFFGPLEFLESDQWQLLFDSLALNE